MKREMCILHSSMNTDRFFNRTRKGNSPPSGPSYGAYHALPFHTEIEEGDRINGLTATLIRDAKILQLIERSLAQSKCVHSAHPARIHDGRNTLSHDSDRPV